MFIVEITYKKALEFIDRYLADHRAFLGQCYKEHYFVVSGPQNPRTGGIIVSQLKDRAQLEEILKHDPFYIHEAADYKIIEFNPIKYHPDFTPFVAPT